MFVNELWQGGVKALLDYDNTLFDNMALPAGINIDDVVDNIILKYGNTPLMIPSPDIMKYYIGKWSSKRLTQWERFKAAIEKQYNPIENYNRTEKIDTTFEHGHTIKTDDDVTNGLIVENTISADNSSVYQPDRKSANTGTDMRDVNEVHGGKDTEHITNNTSGNIGVTTSQQMLASELDLIPRLNVIDYITEDFHSEFCLYVY